MLRHLRVVVPIALIWSCAVAFAQPLPPDATYRQLPSAPFADVKAADEAQKAGVMRLQRVLLEERLDLPNRPIRNVMMSGRRKPVQEGVRVKLRQGTTWDSLADLTPEVSVVRTFERGQQSLEERMWRICLNRLGG